MSQATQGHPFPEKRPTSGKAAKAITGCGGCGCAFGLVSLLAGAVMLGWGMTDRAVDELVAPGAAVLGLAVVVGFFGLAMLIGGIIALRRSGREPPPAVLPPQQPGRLPTWDDHPQGGQGPGYR
jgi:hypothetical protein